MSRNRNNRVLLIVFGVLLVAVVVNQLAKSSKGERSFRDDIIEYTADQISKVVIHSRDIPQESIELYKEDTVWKLRSGLKEYSADQELAKSIASELAYIKPDRLVSKKKDLWNDYEVTDTSGTKVSVYGPKNDKTDLIIGRFSYNQATRKPTTFIRLNKDNDVYGVEGYLSLSFSRDINGLRDKSLYRGNKNDFTRISLTYPADSSLTLVKEDLKWMINGSPADSAKMVQYLNTLGYLTGNEFRDDFNPGSYNGETYSLAIEGINMQSVEIKGFLDASGTVVQSSTNRATFFEGDKSGLAGRIFKGRSYFLPQGN